MFSITGIASGLDTDSMLRQLLQVERLPVVRLEQQQASLRRLDDAWGEITQRLSSFRAAIDDLTGGTPFDQRWKASSSDATAASVTVTGTPTPGDTTFTVGQLATRQGSYSADAEAFASADSLVGAGTFTLLADDGVTELGSVTTDATTTLAGLAADVEAITGVTAQVVKKAEGDHRLVLGSEETGEANGFSVSTDIAAFGGGFTTSAAQDAQITIGGLTLTRSSNTVTDLIDGVALGLEGTGTSTVTVDRDVDSAVASVKRVVDEVNAVLAKLKELSSYDPETKTAGVLQGDPTARRMVDQLRRGVMDLVGGATGDYTTAGSVGIRMNADGGFTLDPAALEAALFDDPAAVDRLFDRSGTSDLTGVAFDDSSATTQAGDYEVVLSQVAKVARLTGASYTAPVTDPQTFAITASDGTVVEVTVAVGDSAAAAVEKINTALASANVDTISAKLVTLADSSTAIELEETRYGSAYEFTVGANDLGLTAGTYGGENVAGTIDGQTATGRGQRLSLPETSTSAAAGLALTVDDGAPLSTPGTVTVATGLVGRLGQLLRTYEGSTGRVESARASLTSRIDLFQDRIDAFDVRIASRETTLRRQFAAMETALAQLQDQGDWLSSQLGSLNSSSQ